MEADVEEGFGSASATLIRKSVGEFFAIVNRGRQIQPLSKWTMAAFWKCPVPKPLQRRVPVEVVNRSHSNALWIEADGDALATDLGTRDLAGQPDTFLRRSKRSLPGNRPSTKRTATVGGRNIALRHGKYKAICRILDTVYQ